MSFASVRRPLRTHGLIDSLVYSLMYGFIHLLHVHTLALADSRGQLLKDIARVSKDITVAYKSRGELREDVECMSAVLGALLEKRTVVEVCCVSLLLQNIMLDLRAVLWLANLLLTMSCVVAVEPRRQSKIKHIGELRAVGFVEGAALQKLRLLQAGFRSRAGTLTAQIAALRAHKTEEASTLFHTYISRLGMERYHDSLADTVGRLRTREVRGMSFECLA
jgi:hypothetical protein